MYNNTDCPSIGRLLYSTQGRLNNGPQLLSAAKFKCPKILNFDKMHLRNTHNKRSRITLRGILKWKIFANSASNAKFAKRISVSILEITEDLPSVFPKYFSPFALFLAIHLNLIYPKFFNIWYFNIIIRHLAIFPLRI